MRKEELQTRKFGKRGASPPPLTCTPYALLPPGVLTCQPEEAADALWQRQALEVCRQLHFNDAGQAVQPHGAAGRGRVALLGYLPPPRLIFMPGSTLPFFPPKGVPATEHARVAMMLRPGKSVGEDGSGLPARPPEFS